MTGAVARNLHEGSRSEILADYLFSTWGTVSPVRRQDDYGVDLFCTLTEAIGQRSTVSDYYSVQVKSTDDPWVVEGPDAVKWLIDHPTPLFLACVNKTEGVLTVYKTLVRFLCGLWEAPDRLELVPNPGGGGEHSAWQGSGRFELSAPILRVTIHDLLDKDKLARLRQVFQFWVRVDNENCTFRRMGLLRLREPDHYCTNELPVTGIVEQGMTRPKSEQVSVAIRTLVEALDCVGVQLLRSGDCECALYAGLLLDRIRTTNDAVFEGDLRWGQSGKRWTLERDLAGPLNKVLLPGRQPRYVFEGLDQLIHEVAKHTNILSDGEPA